MNKSGINWFDLTQGVFFEGLGLGILCVDTKLNILYWNGWLEKHSNLKTRDVIGTPLLELFPEIKERKKNNFVSRCIKNGNPTILSAYLHHHFMPLDIFKDGQMHQMKQNTRIFPVKQNNNIVGAVIIIEDKTESILHEKTILDLNRLLKSLRDINKVLISVDTENQLFERACDILFQNLDLTCVWAGKKDLDTKTGIIPASGRGILLEQLGKEEFEINGNPADFCISHSNSTRDSCKTVITDTCQIDLTAWLSVMKKTQSQSFCLLPLWKNKHLYGIVSVYADSTSFFNEDIKNLLKEIARDLSFGLDVIHERQLRKTAEKNLNKEKRHLFVTLQSIGDGVITTDKKGMIVMMNPIAEKLTGWKQKEAVGQKMETVFRIINEITGEIVENPVYKVMQTQKNIELVNHTLLIRKDGIKIPIHDSGAPILNDDGKITGIILVFQDDTQKREILHKIEENEKKYRSLVDYSADHIFMLSPDGNYLSSNNQTRSFPLKEGEKLTGKSLKDVYSPEIAELYQNKIKEVIEINAPVYFEYELFDLNGDLFYHQNTLYPIFQDDKIQAIGGICNDITERIKIQKEKEKMRQRLQQARKMESIGTLAGGIAHDLNNILFPVIGFTELSMSDLPESHPVQENLQNVLNSALRAKNLVKRILTFSRHKLKKLKPTILKPLVEEAVKLLKSTIPANIDIKTNLYDGRNMVLCDETEFHEVIMNLVTNAYHSIEPRGGKITINLNKADDGINSSSPAAEHVCLSVSDTGCGIPREMIDKIFEPYMTTKEVGKGSGLGLSVVHGIVNNYNGQIKVESIPGKGSVFNVYLPVLDESVAQVPKKDEQTIPGGSEKILLVDDEPDIINLVIKYLERLGYDVTGVPGSREAFKLFETDPARFDMLITDMAMPEMTGLELIEKIRDISKDIPVILCSGYSNLLTDETAKSMGIQMIIDKPVRFTDLAVKIRKILCQSRPGPGKKKMLTHDTKEIRPDQVILFDYDDNQ